MSKTELLPLDAEHYAASIERAGNIIRSGGLVAFPTETVYGLGADAKSPAAVARIFEAKGRPQDNPLIVHIADMRDMDAIAQDISPLARKLTAAFWPGPFTAVLKKREVIPDCVSGGLDTVGIRLPSSAVARDLIAASGTFIAAPSANLSGKPSTTRAEHVVADMDGRIDAVLMGGECRVGLESTVCGLTGETPLILRPGGVTAEMIEAECGRVCVHRAVLEGLRDEPAASPGMKYKHYAPNARVFVAEGNNAEAIAKKIITRYDKDICDGLTALIICAAPHAGLYGKRKTLVLGEDAEDVGHGLFGALRRADADGVDTIYFHAMDSSGMGLAVMNRIVRAAGFCRL